MSTALIVIVVVAVLVVAAFVVFGRRRRHRQLNETFQTHRREAQVHARRADELEAVAAEAREREREHAQVAARAEQRLPGRGGDDARRNGD